MKKEALVKILGMVMITLSLVGCNKNEVLDDEGVNKPNDDDVSQFVSKCEVAAQSAYNVYKTKHTGKIVEGVCSNTFNDDFKISFKVSDKLIYTYNYSFDSNTVDSDDSEMTNTENYDQNKKICDSGNASAYQNLVCSTQSLLFSSHESVKNLSSSEYFKNSYAILDISKLR